MTFFFYVSVDLFVKTHPSGCLTEMCHRFTFSFRSTWLTQSKFNPTACNHTTVVQICVCVCMCACANTPGANKLSTTRVNVCHVYTSKSHVNICWKKLRHCVNSHSKNKAPTAYQLLMWRIDSWSTFAPLAHLCTNAAIHSLQGADNING